jgi:ATP-binding cassette subfamily C protein CydD
MITHRLEQLEAMDQILVLEQGKLVEQGNWRTLQRSNGAFVRLLSQRDGGDLDA